MTARCPREAPVRPPARLGPVAGRETADRPSRAATEPCGVLAEVRRLAGMLCARWPGFDRADAESCAAEALLQVGAGNGALLWAVAQRRAVDEWRRSYATSRRGAPLSRITVPLDVLADRPDPAPAMEDRVADRDEALRALARMSPRERLIVAAHAADIPDIDVAELLGVTPSRVSQLRSQIRQAASVHRKAESAA